MEELNLGADWEKSKKLVVYWHNRWAKAEAEKMFVIEYLNPADTSFRHMVENFRCLSNDDKRKIINLAKSMAELSKPSEGDE